MTDAERKLLIATAKAVQLIMPVEGPFTRVALRDVDEALSDVENEERQRRLKQPFNGG